MRTDRGFTLIELLIVVVIIGILAAIAIPKFSATKEKAFLGTLKTDLRNLATAEEGYYYDNGAYYGGSVPAAGFSFTPSRGVSISIAEATVSGWSASATHANAAGKTCAIYFGNATPVAPATVDGVVACQ
jgi:prepilin-type N-terminal cleavage/methylation domain-containing protein